MLRRSPFLLAGLLVLAVPAPAAAYLNPDSGSFVLQALLGGAAGAAVLLRLVWGRFAGLFRRERRLEGPPPADG